MNYAAGRRSKAVSRHVVQPITRDAFEAIVYVQTWTHEVTGSRVQFDVLAFPQHCEDHGVIRLSGMEGAEESIRHMRLTENRAVIDASMDRRRAVLAVEDEEERDTRAAAWKRQEDGPGDISNLNGASAAEQMHHAYETDRRMR